MLPNIIPTAEPFFFPGGPTGCLLVHGFTGTPKEMRWMGEYLAAQGYSVLGVRLTGHATQPEDLLRARWSDWLTSVADGWHLLHHVADRIFLIGLSMGGILCLRFAAPPYASRCPVSGVIGLSTPYALRADWRLPYIKLLRWLVPSVPKGPPDWRSLEAAQDHIDYPNYPTRAIAELRDLLVEMRSALPEVSLPTLLIHSSGDSGAGGFDPHSMQKIYAHLGSHDKQMLWIEASGHVITRDAQRQQVFQAAADFIARVSQNVP